MKNHNFYYSSYLNLFDILFEIKQFTLNGLISSWQTDEVSMKICHSLIDINFNNGLFFSYLRKKMELDIDEIANIIKIPSNDIFNFESKNEIIPNEYMNKILELFLHKNSSSINLVGNFGGKKPDKICVKITKNNIISERLNDEQIMTILNACNKMLLYRMELIDLFKNYAKIDSLQNLIYDSFNNKITGKIQKTNWNYSVYNLSLNFYNNDDSRFISVEFGPNGKLDAFTPIGFFNFVTKSREPWENFTDIKELITKGYKEFSTIKIFEAFNALEEYGLIENCDHELLKLESTFTLNKNDISYIYFPYDENLNIKKINCSVAIRKKISYLGLLKLGTSDKTGSDFTSETIDKL